LVCRREGEGGGLLHLLVYWLLPVHGRREEVVEDGADGGRGAERANERRLAREEERRGKEEKSRVRHCVQMVPLFLLLLVVAGEQVRGGGMSYYFQPGPTVLVTAEGGRDPTSGTPLSTYLLGSRGFRHARSRGARVLLKRRRHSAARRTREEQRRRREVDEGTVGGGGEWATFFPTNFAENDDVADERLLDE
jgi:hypothetical protein